MTGHCLRLLLDHLAVVMLIQQLLLSLIYNLAPHATAMMTTQRQVIYTHITQLIRIFKQTIFLCINSTLGGKRPRESDVPFVTTTTITTTTNNTKKSKKYDLINHISSSSNNSINSTDNNNNSNSNNNKLFMGNNATFSLPTVVKEEQKPRIPPAPPVYEPRTHQVYSKANSRPGGHFIDELKPGLITDGPGWWSEG